MTAIPCVQADPVIIFQGKVYLDGDLYGPGCGISVVNIDADESFYGETNGLSEFGFDIGTGASIGDTLEITQIPDDRITSYTLLFTITNVEITNGYLEIPMRLKPYQDSDDDEILAFSAGSDDYCWDAVPGMYSENAVISYSGNDFDIGFWYFCQLTNINTIGEGENAFNLQGQGHVEYEGYEWYKLTLTQIEVDSGSSENKLGEWNEGSDDDMEFQWSFWPDDTKQHDPSVLFHITPPWVGLYDPDWWDDETGYRARIDLDWRCDVWIKATQVTVYDEHEHASLELNFFPTELE